LLFAIPPTVSPGPLKLVARLAGSTLTLPFASGTGAAAFRRGDDAVVVFDEQRPVDLSALRGDPVFASARVQVLPNATVLRLDLPATQALRLSRVAAGWVINEPPVAQAGLLAPIRPHPAEGHLDLPATGASRVVSVPDPQTGVALLVGTQSTAGEAVALTRRTPEFELLDTFQGVVVEPLSDDDALRVVSTGFVLEAAGGRALALVPEDELTRAIIDAALLTRRWDFPPLPQEVLVRRLQLDTDAAASDPPQARTAHRLAAVQAAIALGMGVEAEALANLTAKDDGRAAEAPDAGGLAAVAALLAGRLGEADAIEDARLTGTDEVALWRAVRRAQLHEGAPEAAAVFAATLPLAVAYPASLRDRLLAPMAETMVLGGETEAARRLLAARKDDTALDTARAMLAEADGNHAAALEQYDRLAQSPDRPVRARAAVRAVELRLAGGALTAAKAADDLDKLLNAWRGDAREFAVRQRIADLRAHSGDWRGALAMLRDTADGPVAASWPDKRDELRAQMRDLFTRALAADAQTPFAPVDLVTLVEANLDLLADGQDGAALAERLADRLMALNLPRRAGPLLQKLMEGTPPGAARAALGGRLALVLLAQDDPAGALTALSASTANDIPRPLQESRTLTFANATAARGALAPAVATLAALDTPAADEARAHLLEQAQDWPAAAAALSALAARTVPDDGTLDEVGARTLLRLASAGARSGDEALLARLRERDLPRMPQGKLADMFRVLTERPVANVPDLPRAAQETALARGLAADLKSLSPPSPSATAPVSAPPPAAPPSAAPAPAPAR
jgi:hypothetical protein